MGLLQEQVMWTTMISFWKEVARKLWEEGVN